MRARYAPRSPWPPAHVHPRQQERFVVQHGRLRFRIDGVERIVGTGDEVVIPAGVVHQARNDADVEAVAIWRTAPAGRTGDFFEAMHAAEVRGSAPGGPRRRPRERSQ